ncbi:hypothetical protein BACCOPRO_01615 [Phocaeicola coprophilus DSM 18228 = JCM 13818]|uniref:Uncharacterized protein n=1 Tax=Phocaeicola coprophilus DSM 18228 = JCM 13818 TaxID=547042 RepID=S0F714_9BACT|nr:hypothetical protein BACCOPRO_01615 [Phocaeicola coprophilus DSM 18228 = JCM 13818]
MIFYARRLTSSPAKDGAKNTLSAGRKGRFFSNTLKAGLDRTKRRQSNFAEKINRFGIDDTNRQRV